MTTAIDERDRPLPVDHHEPVGEPFNAQPLLIATAIITAVALMFSSAYSTWISAHAHSSSCTRTNRALDAVQLLAFDFIDPPAKPGTVITKEKADRIAAAELDVTNRLNSARCGGVSTMTTVTTTATTGGP